MKALCYRNLCIQSKPVRKLLAKIIIPVMVILFQISFRALSSVKMKKEATVFADYDLDTIVGINRTIILYSPNTPFIRQIMEEVRESIKADVQVLGMFNFLINCRN